MALRSTVASGNWSSPSVWAGGTVPVAGDSVLINAEHDVVFDVSQLGWGSGLGTVTVNGKLRFSNSTATCLFLGGPTYAGSIVINGTVTIGEPESPIPFGPSPYFYYAQVYSYCPTSPTNATPPVTIFNLASDTALFSAFGSAGTPIFCTTGSAPAGAGSITLNAPYLGTVGSDFGLYISVLSGGTLSYQYITATGYNPSTHVLSFTPTLSGSVPPGGLLLRATMPVLIMPDGSGGAIPFNRIQPNLSVTGVRFANVNWGLFANCYGTAGWSNWYPFARYGGSFDACSLNASLSSADRFFFRVGSVSISNSAFVISGASHDFISYSFDCSLTNCGFIDIGYGPALISEAQDVSVENCIVMLGGQTALFENCHNSKVWGGTVWADVRGYQQVFSRCSDCAVGSAVLQNLASSSDNILAYSCTFTGSAILQRPGNIRLEECTFNWSSLYDLSKFQYQLSGLLQSVWIRNSTASPVGTVSITGGGSAVLQASPPGSATVAGVPVFKLMEGPTVEISGLQAPVGLLARTTVPGSGRLVARMYFYLDWASLDSTRLEYIPWCRVYSLSGDVLANSSPGPTKMNDWGVKAWNVVDVYWENQSELSEEVIVMVGVRKVNSILYQTYVSLALWLDSELPASLPVEYETEELKPA